MRTDMSVDITFRKLVFLCIRAIATYTSTLTRKWSVFFVLASFNFVLKYEMPLKFTNARCFVCQIDCIVEWRTWRIPQQL